jgi:hypothetical protein
MGEQPVPGQYIKNYQVQVYMRARETGCTQPESAAIAGFSERSGRRIEQGNHQPKYGQDFPSGTLRERDWRTRPDPLAEVWDSELEPMLRKEPRPEPTTLYEYLVDKYPGQYEQTLRTLQRRIEAWKALYGDPKDVMFELRHEPGEMGLSDFTQLKNVEITIGGKPFEHILYHYRLAYSGWQFVQVIEGGESFIGLSEGLQNALSTCGGVPKLHRTDSLSAAYRNMAGKRYKPLTQFYDQLCQHYGMRPTRNNTGIAHENGAIESSHGHFKQRLTQQLYLRGSFDFESVKHYQAFINSVISSINAKCTTKFETEKQHLQPLPKYRFADYEELSVKVSCYSTIEVRCVLYTVPSRLIGRQLTIHLYHDRLVGYVGKQQVIELARVRGASSGTNRRARCINYRHIIAGLRRKPRAFLYCTWQQEMLPTEQWRTLWQQISQQFDPDSAASVMVEALYIAANQNKETAVADYLEVQLHQGKLTLAGLQQHFQLLHPNLLPQVAVEQHELSQYDQLLNCPNPPASTAGQSQPEPEPAAQTTAPIPYAQSLANPRSESDSRGMVVLPVSASPLSTGGGAQMDSEVATRPQRSATALRKKLYHFQL